MIRWASDEAEQLVRVLEQEAGLFQQDQNELEQALDTTHQDSDMSTMSNSEIKTAEENRQQEAYWPIGLENEIYPNRLSFISVL